MRRDLFVFAGQSNMMGAAVYPPRNDIMTENSFEYKHKERRLGKASGDFVPAAFPAGEFSYVDMEKAYAPDMVDGSGKSLMADYAQNTFFCPSMFNLKSEETKSLFPFSGFSEATATAGVTLAPLLAMEWEKHGGACAYAHIAKGGALISHFMNDEMKKEYKKQITRYNDQHGTNYAPILLSEMSGAADYFLEKCHDFFSDAEKHFSNDQLKNRCFFWLQGESDANDSVTEYETKLNILWKKLRTVGFTHFFCIRVDFFGIDKITNIMRAQENFVSRHSDAYMITRAASYFPYAGRDERDWFIVPPGEEYRDCRDSFYGYANQHINEKGFELIAKRAVSNMERILNFGEEPSSEEENIRVLT